MATNNLFLAIFLSLSFSPNLFAKAAIDLDVIENLQTSKMMQARGLKEEPLSIIVFLHDSSEKQAFIQAIKKMPVVEIQDLGFMPAVAIQIPNNINALTMIADVKQAAQISSHKASTKELDISTQAIKLSPSTFYPTINNWWAHGYTGGKAVVGLIDTGVDPTHPGLAGKKLLLRQEGGSGYSDYLNGVTEPHATGVACIYASGDDKLKGVAHSLPTILSGLAGEETADTSSIMLTLSTLDWMLNRAEIKPDLINYSMGNGPLSCPTCPEWSGLARVIDYVVNTQKILWVKSAGNNGYITPTQSFPYSSTLTVPGDNYNALTIANMNLVVSAKGVSGKTADRTKHMIMSTSSRGPTPYGRRKPDLSAPGNDTRTCAPDPQVYGFKYTALMDYKNGYRLMGGTSSAAPHVGASALLMQEAGIKNPIAIKALLINSADTWSDAGTPIFGHKQISGSVWNRTYGWGYLNMEKAYDQKDHIIEALLSIENPFWEQEIMMNQGEKVTLVHERRVGYSKNGKEWQLSHLKLELIDKDNNTLIDSDDSAIDSVHQVANCSRALPSTCLMKENKIKVLVRVQLLSTHIDGANEEPFALAYETAP